MAGAASAPNVDIMIAGKEVPDGHFLGYTVSRDMFQPDHATIELSNDDNEHSDVKAGDSVTISVDQGTKIYEGVITAVKAVFKGDGKTTINIHSLNKLTKLTHARKSKTYQSMTDQAILNQICGQYGLSLKWEHKTSVTYPHVYQHNQTDLEFMRTRAARAGAHLWCVGNEVHVKQPNFDNASGLKLSVDKAGGGALPIRTFTPMMDAGGIVKKVTVRGWNPETKQEIKGEASAKASKLGSKHASSGAGDLGGEETFVVDHPIWDAAEAKMLAEAQLMERSLKFMVAECEISGNKDVDLGTTVDITVSSTKQVPYNGHYYVMGIRHQHKVEKNKSAKAGEGGFTTVLRLARDGQS